METWNFCKRNDIFADIVKPVISMIPSWLTTWWRRRLVPLTACQSAPLWSSTCLSRSIFSWLWQIQKTKIFKMRTEVDIFMVMKKIRKSSGWGLRSRGKMFKFLPRFAKQWRSRPATRSNSVLPILRRWTWSSSFLVVITVIISVINIREPVKNYLADFFPLWGVPPISVKGFW